VTERARDGAAKQTSARLSPFGTAAVSARQQFSWLWSRESLLRLALSFVLALALWLYITGKQDPSLAQDFPQPLAIVPANLANGLSETTNVSTVHVRYRSDAPGAIVTAVNFHPFINLAGKTAGPPVYVPVQVIPDPGLHVVQVSPSRVLVTIDRMTSRTMQLTPELVTSPPSGYTSGPIRLVPSTIHLQGPQSVLSQVASAVVEIDLTQVTATMDNSYKPVLRDSGGAPVADSNRIQIDPPQVLVHVPVAAISSAKSLPVLVPLEGHVRAGYQVVSVTANPEEVVSTGPPAALRRVTAVYTRAISLSGRKTTTTFHVPLELTRGTSSSTGWVNVTVGIAPLKK
jgi:YbbR domain-containing protein